MLLSAAVILALFALTWTLLSRSFLQITTASGASGKAVYREKAVKRRSIDGALFGKELARFTASPNYHAQLRAWHPAAASRGRGAAD